MRKHTADELKQLIENHGHWLREDCDGWENMQANLSGADLSRANLSGADLSGADLPGADLYRADLYRADLSRADLSGADLFGADLSRADLSGADLFGADLSRADLSRADLYRADLSGANLSRANLSRADLSGADLFGADLYGADLSRADLFGADLSGADLSGAKNIPYIPITCPDAGAFIAWKKVNGYIVKLQIPEDAKRCSAASRKCRCDKALVLAIETIEGEAADVSTLTNYAHAKCVYTVGEMVYPDSWDDNRWNQCSHGIHFFVNRQEAVNW